MWAGGGSALVEELNTHVGIYTALEASVLHGDRFPETDVDRHVGRLFLQVRIRSRSEL